MFAADSLQHSSSPVYVSNSGALRTGDRCSVLRLAGEVDVHVSTIYPAEQSNSEAQVHPRGRGYSNSPLVAISAMVSTSTPPVSGPPSHHSVRLDLLPQQIIPSACMEALMQHY